MPNVQDDDNSPALRLAEYISANDGVLLLDNADAITDPAAA